MFLNFPLRSSHVGGESNKDNQRFLWIPRLPGNDAIIDFLHNLLMREKLEETRSTQIGRKADLHRHWLKVEVQGWTVWKPECTRQYMRIRAPNLRTSSP